MDLLAGLGLPLLDLSASADECPIGICAYGVGGTSGAMNVPKRGNLTFEARVLRQPTLLQTRLPTRELAMMFPRNIAMRIAMIPIKPPIELDNQSSTAGWRPGAKFCKSSRMPA